MHKKTFDTVLIKLASGNRAPRLLAAVIAMRKQASVAARKQEVQTKLASIMDGVLNKQEEGLSNMRKELEQPLIKKAALVKMARPIGEMAAALGYNAVPYINAANSVGGLAGMFGRPATEKEETEWDRKDTHNLIPGVGAYRMNRRMKRQLKADKGGTPHYWSQGFGGLSAALLATAAGALGGAGIGAGVGKATGKGSGTGAGLGAAAGAMTGLGTAGIASIVAAIKAAVDRRRTKEEQKAYANSPTTKEWLIPGVGTYNAWKTVGRAIGDAEERAQKEDKD